MERSAVIAHAQYHAAERAATAAVPTVTEGDLDALADAGRRITSRPTGATLQSHRESLARCHAEAMAFVEKRAQKGGGGTLNIYG